MSEFSIEQAFTAGWRHGMGDSQRPTYTSGLTASSIDRETAKGWFDWIGRTDPAAAAQATQLFSQLMTTLHAAETENPDAVAKNYPPRVQVLYGLQGSGDRRRYFFWHGLGDGGGRSARIAADHPISTALWGMLFFSLNRVSPRMLTLGILASSAAGLFNMLTKVNWDQALGEAEGTTKTILEQAKGLTNQFGANTLNDSLVGLRERVSDGVRPLALLIGAALILKFFIGQNAKNITPQGLPDIAAMSQAFGCGLIMGNYIITPIETKSEE